MAFVAWYPLLISHVLQLNWVDDYTILTQIHSGITLLSLYIFN